VRIVREAGKSTVRVAQDLGLTLIADYDTTAKPFKWTYAADPLVA